MLFCSVENFSNYSPLNLAYIGDCAYEIMVREYLLSQGNRPVKDLHRMSVEFVRCEFQAEIIKEVLLDIMTEEEMAVYTRGRNAKVPRVPKNSSSSDYHAATGFEALFGYIYLKNDTDRLKEFFSLIVDYSINKSK